ncbi:beclin, putative [Pediculus humanus corporis]|uniref:Beclin, putative n=1 Tax=Pediculus humanus subsp. corporis TaxID=121224 RepID=E0VSM0_PEDHC|nr:beclin, putative [Pediculus humanus corporis]EEB16376.1 beclin, putative [Pediculus humanus corporis]
MDHFVPAFRVIDSKNGSNGFMLIDGKGESQNLSQQVTVTAGLFDIMSSNSYIDHPLCEECSESLLDLMDQQLKLTEEELNDYSNFLRKIENEDDFDNIEDLERELENLKNEEETLIGELKTLQEKEKKAKELLEREEQEKERLDREEEKYWREYSHHRRDLMVAEDESKSLECQLAYTQSQLEKLKKTNVFNATFHIWHSGGHFGTINNFRLGRLPSAPVDWSEINAAWGQTALLLSALARKINLTFQRYKVVPFGNHSYIEVLEDHKELPLYGSGGIRYLWDSKFDAAMVAFLDCLQQFKNEMEKGNSEFCLPYKMDKGKIEDSATGISFSIKTHFNSEEQWTKALKFLLTNLKWALAWVFSQFTRNEIDSGN